VLVTPPEPIAGGDRAMLGFETLTLAPIDRRLIETSLLTPAEIAWMNAYHARVAETIGPHLSAAEADWLKHATAAL
jgi:Xaa-Pro aminopeptidase